MIFTSYTYLAFLCLGLGIHWAVPRSWRNGVLIALSYIFYCSWRWEFGFLLLGVTLFTWWYGRIVARRRSDGVVLALGVLIEFVPLIIFKYLGFLFANVNAVVSLTGSDWRLRALDLALPLGISFFTFQAVAYLVDVAGGEEPIPSLEHFLLYKSFWPQLIAGPIIRPHEIRDQIASDRSIAYDDVAEGAERILSGFFKKAVLADNLAPYVDAVYQRGAAPGGVDALVGTVAFALQIYFDFSGYSDIAIGSARLLGFRFPENFDYPYTARSPQEFWNRWHMTLTRWIRDYVFTPLAFASRRRRVMGHLALVLAMALCGLWHGGRWTFVLWGVWHGVLLVANHTFLRSLWSNLDAKGVSSARRFLAWATSNAAVLVGWVLFRTETLAQAGQIFEAVATMRFGWRPAVLRENAVLTVAAMTAGLLVFQLGRARLGRVLERLRQPLLGYRAMRGMFYAALVLAVVVFERDVKAFVYFQF